MTPLRSDAVVFSDFGGTRGPHHDPSGTPSGRLRTAFSEKPLPRLLPELLQDHIRTAPRQHSWEDSFSGLLS